MCLGMVYIYACPFFILSYVGKGHGGLYKVPTKEERRKQKGKRREGSLWTLDVKDGKL